MKRRKVGNLLGLAVLSVVGQRPMHPYEMASMLRERGKDQDMPIKWGSLYTVVRNLQRHGLIEVAESSRQGSRPERTIYRITGAGREELADWVRELVSTPEPEYPRFQAGLSVIGVLSPDEAIALLGERLRLVERAIDEQREWLAKQRREIPRLFLVEDEYALALQGAEAGWIRSLLQELTTGSLPGIELWRSWRATGEVPPEFADLAERGSTPDHPDHTQPDRRTP